MGLRQGIQDEFDGDLGDYGCYFLDLCRWAEIYTGGGFDSGDIEFCLSEMVREGFVEDDCFVVNPPDVLNFLCEFLGNPSANFSTVRKTTEPPKRDIYITYLSRPGHRHFVLVNNGEIWDSLNPNRPQAKEYKPESYREIS